MSELIKENNGKDSIRWKLLTGASALALTAYVGSPNLVHAEDADRPTVWIELGGQLSHLQDGQETFAPSIMNGRPSMFEPSQKFEKLPANSFDWQGKIALQPSGSDWVFSAAVRYGRASSNRKHREQTNPAPFSKYYYTFSYYRFITATKPPIAARFADTQVQNSERHLVMDFQAGKDVGLGLFGSREGTSVISAGVRFAQFSSGSNIALKSDPDWHFNTRYFAPWHIPITWGQPFHSNLASMNADRDFHGIGPSVSWAASLPLAGNPDDRAIMFDWGVNAAVLFGRQKAQTHHQTTGRYHSSYGFMGTKDIVLQTTFKGPAAPDHIRSRNVTVPNIGGFAGLTFKYTNAKVSFGYRADFFFGAMDGGIDARKTYDRNFYGPYATISIGLGG